MRQPRRAFLKKLSANILKLSAGAKLLCAVGQNSGYAQEADPSSNSWEQSLLTIPIVDTHQHLWDLKRLRLPWLAGAPKINRSFLLEDYLEAVKGLPLQKAVYMEVAVDESQLREEAELVIELCAAGKGPTVAAVIGGRPAAPNFDQYIRTLAKSPYVKGVRHILPGEQPDLWDRPEFIKGIRTLGELGLCFDLCLPPDRLEIAERLVARCPDTKFVLDHCGNADPVAFMSKSRLRQAKVDRPPQHSPAEWRQAIDRLARHPHVVCKISGIIARAPAEAWVPSDLAPIVNSCIEAFGEDRVMFGSDWPVCLLSATFCQWVEALHQIVADRSPEFKRKLFYDNAVHFYGLAGS